MVDSIWAELWLGLQIMESQCKWTIFPENVLSLNCSVTLAGWQCVIWGVSVVLLSRNLHVSGKSFLHAIAQGDLVYHGYVSLSILFGEMIAVHQQRGATNISQFRASCQTRLVCRSAIKQIFCFTVSFTAVDDARIFACCTGGVWQMPTWLILPVVICLSQSLSHACLSISSLLRNCEWLIITVIIF